MPQTKQNSKARTTVRLPTPMVDEIDRIVEQHPEFNYNRQQFIESAIREKIIVIKKLELGMLTKPQHDDEQNPK